MARMNAKHSQVRSSHLSPPPCDLSSDIDFLPSTKIQLIWHLPPISLRCLFWEEHPLHHLRMVCLLRAKKKKGLAGSLKVI